MTPKTDIVNNHPSVEQQHQGCRDFVLREKGVAVKFKPCIKKVFSIVERFTISLPLFFVDDIGNLNL